MLWKKFLSFYFRNPRVISVLGKPILVLPGVFFPGSFNYGKFFLSKLDIKRNKRILDMCCGTGVLSILLSDKTDDITCVDVNPNAVSCTRINSILNNTNLKVIESNFFDDVPRTQKFDYVLFTGPYYINSGYGLCKALSVEDAKRFSEQVHDYVVKKGVVYVLTVPENEAFWIKSLKGFSTRVIGRKRTLTFKISVLKAQKSD
jgi:tRNA1(Val) A37 N6-methylase TrmN6